MTRMPLITSLRMLIRPSAHTSSFFLISNSVFATRNVMGAATMMHANPTNEDHWMTSYSITNDATMKMGAPHRLCSSWNRSCSLFTSLLIRVTILPVVSSCSPCGESFRHLRYSAHIRRLRTRTPRRCM